MTTNGAPNDLLSTAPFPRSPPHTNAFRQLQPPHNNCSHPHPELRPLPLPPPAQHQIRAHKAHNLRLRPRRNKWPNRNNPAVQSLPDLSLRLPRDGLRRSRRHRVPDHHLGASPHLRPRRRGGVFLSRHSVRCRVLSVVPEYEVPCYQRLFVYERG